mgnify:CR=1 FL=1
MKLTITDTEKLSKFSIIFQYLKLISEEINLNFTENGLYTQALGTNHVCLVEFMIHKNWFSNYTIENGCSLGINCETFYSVLSCLEKNNSFEMKYDDCDYLYINIKGDKIEKKFEMRLMVIDEVTFDIPKTEYTSDIIILSKSFSEYVNELDIFGDLLTINCNGKNSDNITLKTIGDNGTMELIINDDYLEEYSVEEDTILDVSYSMNYIKKMTNFVKLSNNVELHLSKDIPLKMTYRLCGDDNENNYMNIYLAPKIDDD